MTATEKVLQRRDGASLIVGVVLAFVTLQFVTALTSPVVTKLMATADGTPPFSFKDQILTPLVSIVLQLIVIELLIWIVVGVRSAVYPTVKKGRK